LGETGPLAKSAVAELIHILQKDTDDEARLQACLALGNIGPDARAAVPALIESLLQDKSYKAFPVRVNAAGSLGQIASDPDKVVPALVEAYLTDPEPEVQTWALLGLRQFPSAPALAQKTLEALSKEPRNQQSSDFQARAERVRGILKARAKEPAPTEKAAPAKSK
jgi:HEAT repeat protein